MPSPGLGVELGAGSGSVGSRAWFASRFGNQLICLCSPVSSGSSRFPFRIAHHNRRARISASPFHHRSHRILNHCFFHLSRPTCLFSPPPTFVNQANKPQPSCCFSWHRPCNQYHHYCPILDVHSTWSLCVSRHLPSSTSPGIPSSTNQICGLSLSRN